MDDVSRSSWQGVDLEQLHMKMLVVVVDSVKA